MERRTWLETSNVLLGGLILFFLASTAYFYYKGLSDTIADKIVRNQNINTLFVIHQDKKPLLISYMVQNPKTKRMSLFDIPANTGITVRSLKRIDRIDTVFNPKRPDEFISLVQQLLGLPTPPLYILCDINHLPILVDLMQGIDVFIPNAMEQLDADIPINLPAGAVFLDGAKASEYLLLRENNEANNHWVDRRQNFSMSLVKRISQKSVVITHPKSFPLVYNNLRSNMDKKAMLSLLRELSIVDSQNMGYQRITGTVRTVDHQQLLFPNYDGRLLKETVSQTLTSLASTENAGNVFLPSKIEIQNGTERNGLGTRTAKIFSSMGYNVVGINNSSSRIANTVVIDLVGNIEAAQKVGDIIHASNVYSLASAGEGLNISTSNADIQVILGDDFDGRFVQRIQGE